ncbi:MAG: hypothetical protein AB8B85_02530 [Paracoccaceae bacterium]
MKGIGVRGIGPWRPPRIHRNRDEPVMRFQVMGERCSGTNYLSKLILQNVPGLEETRDAGWKHGFVLPRGACQPSLLVLIIVRHPVRWIQSVHRAPWELAQHMHALQFAAFIRAPWEPVSSGNAQADELDFDPASGLPFSNAWAMRAAKIEHHEALADMPCNAAYLRHEDVNRDPARTLRALADGFGLSLAPQITDVRTYKESRTAPYLPRQFPPISPEDRAFLDTAIDQTTENKLGYDHRHVPLHDGLGSFSYPVMLRRWKMAKARLGLGRPIKP